MQLSIIIVSYNVRYFLEQCLSSVIIAAAAVEGEVEVIVVDNNSPDQSVSFLTAAFPSVRFIASAQNLGFGKANNLALKQAKGEFILFLNPDTILPEDGLIRIIAHLKQKTNAGAAGIRMIDGTGQFLPESKRGFPGPWTSFCKMFGITRLRPKSKLFAKYYLGHLDSNQNQQVEILAGAYMLVRKKALDEVGGFDEQFFMYAEDIDLSYRILQKGYINYYFAETPIIHFKGESTRKDARYVTMFYQAMIQFVRKHFTGSTSFFYRKFLEAGIRLRSGFSMAIVKESAVTSVLPVRKAVLMGDPNSINEARLILRGENRVSETGSLAEADLVIYCIGRGHSASTAIQHMQSHGKQKLFHFLSTKSIVGSHSSESSGELFALP